MMDWADDVADSLCAWNPMSDGTLAWFAHCDVIATALRKAKADGMREAADLVASNECEGDIGYAQFLFGKKANEIEKGK